MSLFLVSCGGLGTFTIYFGDLHPTKNQWVVGMQIERVIERDEPIKGHEEAHKYVLCSSSNKQTNPPTAQLSAPSACLLKSVNRFFFIVMTEEMEVYVLLIFSIFILHTFFCLTKSVFLRV